MEFSQLCTFVFNLCITNELYIFSFIFFETKYVYTIQAYRHIYEISRTMYIPNSLYYSLKQTNFKNLCMLPLLIQQAAYIYYYMKSLYLFPSLYSTMMHVILIWKMLIRIKYEFFEFSNCLF